jgi:hypothetical protein
MNRRKFLQTIAAAGAMSAQPAWPLGTSVSDVNAPHPFPHELNNPTGNKPLFQLENEFLRVTLFPDATSIILDRKHAAQWRMGPVAFQEEAEIDVGAVWLRTDRSICEQYPGRFRGRREGDNIRFWLLGREMEPKGSFLVHVALNGPWLEYRLLEIEEQLSNLNFPPPIESDSLVLPMHLGRWIQKPLEGRFFYTFFSHLNMRWFGGLKQNHSWIAVFPEPNFVDSGVMLAEMSASPTWLKQLGRWSEPRVVRYRFVEGNYVNLAKVYKDWAIEKGIHRSLTAKLATTPALAELTQGQLISIMEAEPKHGKEYDEDLLRPSTGDSMLGSGPRVMFTHDEVLECIGELPGVGVDRALVVVRGWIPGGYDYSHPDVWPPEPKLGSIAELKRLCASSARYPVALHDNYQDIYQQSKSWPHGVIRERNGKRMPGGYWAGGQAYILNARDGLTYARRNWQALSQLHLRAYFVDTTSAVQMYQSYEAGNTLTRSEDQANKEAMLAFFKTQGVILGSEEGADFAVPYLDWNENRHARQPGESVPLWPLVFHDAVVSGRYISDGSAADWAGERSAAAGAPLWLEDMLWGYVVMSRVDNYADRDTALRSMAAKQHVAAWFRRISTSAMVDHRFLTSDFTLEETRFSNGWGILVNFAGKPQTCGTIQVPAYGYKIFNSATADI